MHFRLLLCAVVLARPAAAQSTTVSGVVRDSIARKPLAGALVQLVTADSLARLARAAVSDSQGRFTLADIAAGHYTLGFFHPMLDSLGLEPTLRDVSVAGRPVRADLAIPTAARLRSVICGARSGRDSGAVVVGVVRDALGRAPLAGVTVTGEWIEMSITTQGLTRRTPRISTTTAANGWFALCNVPSPGTMALMASRGADSTDLIEVQVPPDGFLRRELSIGPARTVVTGDTTRSADTLAPPPLRRRSGDGRLTGVVVTVVGSAPLSNAQVSIPEGPQTRSNERGEWTLVDAPGGTRTLEVRAVGYYPERRSVDVVTGAALIRTALFTMKAMLDTVKVTARHLSDPNMIGFDERRRSGVGRYITREMVERRAPIVSSDLFRMVPGLRFEGSGIDKAVWMRSAFGGGCAPAVFINGRYMSIMRAGDIDDWVSPDEVAGIEIYPSGTVPAQYDMGMTGCGSIVIWTQLSTKPKPKWTKAGFVRVAGVLAAAGLLTVALYRR